MTSTKPKRSSTFAGIVNFKNSYYDKFKKNFLQEAQLRNLSNRTQESYWWHINDYQNFHKKDPFSTGIEQLRAYFSIHAYRWHP